MAKVHLITAVPAEKPLNFTATDGLYRFSKKATQDDIRSQLDARLSQLSGMMMVVTGTGAESFQEWNEEIRDNYLWAVRDLVLESKELASALA